mgnify:FL=1
MTIGFSDFKRGTRIEIDDIPYEILEYEREKKQKRASVIRIKLRDMLTAKVIERTFQSNEFKLAEIETLSTQYLYNDGQFHTFMDLETFEQYQLTKEQIDNASNYLKENENVDLISYKEKIISVNLPISVILEVTETDPGFKGDTAQAGSKPATLETGLLIQVPIFINIGEKIKVDTRTGEYMERAQ